MPIDTGGEWWKGSEPGDIAEYLTTLTSDSYPATDIRPCRCPCGAVDFELRYDPDAGCAQRTCTGCGTQHLICDSGDYWSEAEPELLTCVCGKPTFNIAVGFALRQEGDVRWITVGHRCIACGVLGAAVDWKVDYSPSLQLVDQV